MQKLVKNAVALKEAAERNILAKLELLNEWAVEGVPLIQGLEGTDSKYEYFPTSLRQFKAWTLVENSEEIRFKFGLFNRTGNDTLANYPVHAGRARELIKAIKLACQERLMATEGDDLPKLKKEIDLLRKIIDIRSLEVCSAHEEISSLRKEVDRLLRALNNERSEFKRLLGIATCQVKP
ncbi:hypothetical protein ACMFY5_08380 [Pseudomonas sihuiensis]|jgi:hypothetical protein